MRASPGSPKNQAVFGVVGTGRASGAHASHVLVPQEQLVAASGPASSSALAVLPYSFTTGWLAVMSTGLRASNATGMRVLVNGANGGLGRLALHLLRTSRRWRITAICAQGSREDCALRLAPKSRWNAAPDASNHCPPSTTSS